MGSIITIPSNEYAPSPFDNKSNSSLTSQQRSDVEYCVANGILFFTASDTHNINVNNYHYAIGAYGKFGIALVNGIYYGRYYFSASGRLLNCQVLGNDHSALYYTSVTEGLSSVSDLSSITISNINPGLVPYASLEDLTVALLGTYPITYHLINCSAPTAPTEAVSGATVTVSLQFNTGYSVANNSDAYVMNNGVIVPSTYSNGTLTFTMP